ncbi:MAG: hypothetical protein H8E66_32225 [Planctomycetes bacterium]|nr:hypothetical protein [Planctomycetota bacterium]
MRTRLKHSLFAAMVAAACALTFGHPACAQSFDRLPPTTPAAQLERLPPTNEGPSVNGPQREAANAVRFAGGGIELQIPPGWWSGEVPFGREIRFVVAPARPASTRKMPVDGMWMAYHASSLSDSPDEATLPRYLSERLRLATSSNSQYSPATPFQFGNWAAVVADFTSTESASPNTSITGRHVLVRTDWGIFEFHASAPDTIVESRSNRWTAVWESLRLNLPTTANGLSQNDLTASDSIIGDWKSYRSRMRFSKDGRVVIVPDAIGDDRNANPLAGTFQARDDLVFVQWDDGTRLNFRWRLHDNDLFLTDHEGQISHLKRVFN